MSDFDTLFTKCNDLWVALRRKGTLVLSGRSGDFELSYVYYDDFVAVVSGHPTALAACEALLAKLTKEAEEKAAQVRAEADAKIASLTV